MGFRFNSFFILIILLSLGQILLGCISLQFVKRVDGADVVFPVDKLEVGRTTMGEVLSLLGAPDELEELEGGDLFLYKRSVFRQSRLSVGIPVFDIWGSGIDFSTYGTLLCYDTKGLILSPDKILQQIVFEKCADRSYLKTILKEK
jgi:hypothetical protein